jgi:hypothetical protein
MERIELADHPHRRHRVWESGEPGHWRHTLLEIGVLDDGRPYAAQSRRGRTLAWAAYDERQAATAVEKWMGRLGTGWRETTGQDA